MDPATMYLAGTAISALGGWLGGRGQEQANAKQLAESRRQFDARLGQEQLQTQLGQLNAEQSRLDSLGAAGVNIQQQTPNRVNWRQNQAMLAAIMPQLRNVSVSSGIPGMNAFIPQVSGGLRIPEGGFSPETLKFFGDRAMLAGEADLDRQGQIATGGQMAIPNYSAVYGQLGAPAQQAVGDLQSQVKADEEKRKQQRNAILFGALTPNAASTGPAATRRGSTEAY